MVTASDNPDVLASIVITTHGRKDDLRKALRSCLGQTGTAIEVLVYDDASTDGTQEMVCDEFPTVRYFRQEQRVGYIVLRNRGFNDARGEYVFSLDDDAWFTSTDTVAEAVEAFQQTPKAAAFALRYAETPSESDMVLMPELSSGANVRSYIGCAHAIRRNLVLEVGVYREFFVHQGEERDLCIRLRDRGHEIQFLQTPPIVHAPSPKRDRTRWHYFGIRNTFLFTILNVPARLMLFRLSADVLLLSKHSIRVGGILGLRWVMHGLGSALRCWRHRRPVQVETYRAYRDLTSAGPSDVYRSETDMTRCESSAHALTG